MTQTLLASDLSLHEVKQQFGLEQISDPAFFPEWQTPLPEISPEEQRWLDRIKSDFVTIEEYPLHEEIVKMAVLSPLLSLAGFFRYPFYPKAEFAVAVTAADGAQVVKGKVDVLVLRQQLWVTVIEAKNQSFSLHKALPQALFYMMTSPNTAQPIFGLVMNGSHFRFIKLLKEGTPCYALSDDFSLQRQTNELYSVLGILRRLGDLITD